MRSNSFSETHWTDEQLMDSLYAVGPEDNHLRHCSWCTSRQAVLVSNRQGFEASLSNVENVKDRFLAIQRRAICQKLDQGISASWRTGLRGWAPVSLALLLLAGGLAIYQEHQAGQMTRNQPSDAQLALEVSAMSQEWQDQPAAPLRGLFE